MEKLDILIKTIYNLAAKNQCFDMCALLKNQLEHSNQHNDLVNVIALEGQLTLVQNEFRQGLLDEENFFRKYAQIRLALLEIVNRMRLGELPSFFPKEAHQQCEAICTMLGTLRLDCCIKLLKDLLWQFPKFSRALVLMGVAQGLSGHHRVAIRYFKDAHYAVPYDDPSQIEILVNLGTAYLLIGSSEKALLYWQMAEARGSEIANQWKEYFISLTNKTII